MSFGLPWVAQRVWPSPTDPFRVVPSRAAFNSLELARPLDALQSCGATVGALHDGHAGRVVASVLEALQAVDDNSCCLAVADVSYDAAHEISRTSW